MVRFSINRTIFMIITSEHGSPTHCVIYGARTKTNIGLRYILTRRAKPIRNVLSSNPIPHPLPPPTACWCRWPKCHSSMLLGSTMESWTTPEYDELCGPGQVERYWLVRSLISYYERTMTYVFWPAWTEIFDPIKASRDKRPGRRKRRNTSRIRNSMEDLIQKHY